MKQLVKIILVLAALSAGTSVYAQRHVRSGFPWSRYENFTAPGRISVRASVSGTPIWATQRFTSGKVRVGSYDPYVREPKLSDIYSEGHGPTRCTGAFGVGADFFLTRRFAFSLDLMTDIFWNERFDSYTLDSHGRHAGAAIYLLPRAKFIYMNRPMVRLYGSLGVGGVYYAGFDKVAVSDRLRPCFQVSPLGVEYGQRFFGFAEAGFGSMFNGFQAGFGYKF